MNIRAGAYKNQDTLLLKQVFYRRRKFSTCGESHYLFQSVIVPVPKARVVIVLSSPVPVVPKSVIVPVHTRNNVSYRPRDDPESKLPRLCLLLLIK
jgi:hypothetical protein